MKCSVDDGNVKCDDRRCKLIYRGSFCFVGDAFINAKKLERKAMMRDFAAGQFSFLIFIHPAPHRSSASSSTFRTRNFVILLVAQIIFLFVIFLELFLRLCSAAVDLVRITKQVNHN